jgi:hypothetical protein
VKGNRVLWKTKRSITDKEETKMKRKTVLATILGLALVTASYGLVQAHGGSGSSWFGMGSGHMGGSGWGHMGSGRHMDGPNWDHVGMTGALGFEGVVYGHDHMWRSERPLTGTEARDIAEHTLGRSPYLKVGTVTEEGDRFKVEIVTSKSDELVNRLLVEKDTGRVFPVEK